MKAWPVTTGVAAFLSDDARATALATTRSTGSLLSEVYDSL